jgi:tetratricopeptide (TPR) repeat protein
MGRDAGHVTKEQLHLFLARKLPKERAAAVVRHLLSGCPGCLALAREAGWTSVLPGPPADIENIEYDAIFRRLDLLHTLVEGDILAERERAESLWARLQSHSPERRLLIVRHEERYHLWGLYERILAESRKASRTDPLAAADLAYLALAVVDRLNPRTYGDLRLHDFRGAAWVALANAKRMAADFAGCQDALRNARAELDQGTEDPLEEAHLWSVHGSSLTDLGELEQAVAVLERAVVCARRIGDRHFEGRTVLQQASAIAETDPRRGIELARRALSLLNREQDPHLELGAWHILAFCLAASGEPREAEAILAPRRHLYLGYSDPQTLARLCRLEAWIAREKGELIQAEHLFREQRALYAEHDLDFDQVLAALELAEVLTLQTRITDALEILAETYPVLQAWGLQVDVLRSWILLEKSVKARAVDVRAFRDLAELLRRRWFRST